MCRIARADIDRAAGGLDAERGWAYFRQVAHAALAEGVWGEDADRPLDLDEQDPARLMAPIGSAT